MDGADLYGDKINYPRYLSGTVCNKCGPQSCRELVEKLKWARMDFDIVAGLLTFYVNEGMIASSTYSMILESDLVLNSPNGRCFHRRNLTLYQMDKIGNTNKIFRQTRIAI